MKRIITAALFLVAFLFVAPIVSASGFYIETIGSMQVGGTAYDHYWYTGANPVITGIAPANAAVTVTVDGAASTVNSTASGTWSYQTAITEGDHAISLSTASIATPYSFTLTIGEVPDGVGAIDPGTTPVAGSTLPTLMLIFLGIGLIISPFLLRKFALSS